MIKDMTGMIEQVASDLHQLLFFTYELRAQDTPDNKYTHDFLDNLSLNEVPFVDTIYF
jgi:hypothetical protein